MLSQVKAPEPKYVIEQKAQSYLQNIRPNYIDWGKLRENTIEPIASIVATAEPDSMNFRIKLYPISNEVRDLGVNTETSR